MSFSRLSVFASSVATLPLSLVLILCGTIPAHGQSTAPRSATRQVEASQRPQHRNVVLRSPAVLESYRAQMMTILANFYEIGRLNAALGRLHPSAPADQLAEPPAVRAMGLMQEASNADLNLLMEYVPDIQPLLSSTDLLRVLVQAEVDAQRESVGSGTGGGGSGTGGGGSGTGGGESPGFPNASYSSQCGSVPPSTTVLLASFVTLKTAEMVREDASRHCDLVVVSAGAGGNTSLACLVSDAVFITAKFTHETLQFCDGDINSAENNGTYRRVEHLHNDIASVQFTLDNKIELRRVDLQVLNTKNPRRYLVLSTDFGLPVNVSFLAVDAFDENIGDFVPFPSTITPRSPGVYVVTLDLRGDDDDDDDDDSPKIFRINVQDAAVPAHFGQVVFRRMNDDD